MTTRCSGYREKRSIILIFTIALLCFGVVGCQTYKGIIAEIPENSFDEFSLTSQYGPFYNVSIIAKGGVKTEDTLRIREFIYTRGGNVTSTQVTIKGYERDLK